MYCRRYVVLYVLQKVCGAVCIAEGMWYCMCCRKYLTNNHKKAHELCTQRNPDCRMYVHGCKETNKPEKLSPMNNKKITEMKTKEIKKELQDNQISHVNESVGEQSWRAETEFSTNNRRSNGNTLTG
jgi:hypothetical protein